MCLQNVFDIYVKKKFSIKKPTMTDHIYQPLQSGRIWHKVNFQAEFNRFEFRVFLLLD